MKKLLTTMLVTAVLMGFMITPAAAYPDKPVTFVVPWPPGDFEDILTRLIAEEFQKEYGVPAAVVNKPGGGGGPFPGAVSVAKAPPDGSTIGSFVISVPTIGPQIGIPELNPNPFEPLGIFMTYPFVVVASKKPGFKDLKGLAEYAKKNKVALGHFGAPLPPTKVAFAIAKSMGFSWGSDAAFDALECNVLASGDVDVMTTTIAQVMPCLNDIVVLVAATNRRVSILPDVPTVGEVLPELDLFLWNGLFVHKDTPANVREKIIPVAKRALQSERAKKLSKEMGVLIYWMDAEESKAQIKKDIATFSKINKMLEK